MTSAGQRKDWTFWAANGQCGTEEGVRLPTLSCSHLRPRNLHPLSAPTPATLTWISLSARSSCRGSPLPAAQLSPENIEHGEESPHLPQCCPLYPHQPWARSEGFPFSPSPLTVTTVLKVTEGVLKGEGEDVLTHRRTPSTAAAPSPTCCLLQSHGCSYAHLLLSWWGHTRGSGDRIQLLPRAPAAR